MKKYIIFLLVFSISILSLGNISMAGNLYKEYNLDSKDDYAELLGISSKIYSTEFNNMDYDARFNKVISKKITDLIVSKDSVDIKGTGESEFIDAIIKYDDGTYENISDIVNWESSNPNIAMVDQGRILALDKGSIEVRVSFVGIEKVIGVNIFEKIDIAKEIMELESDNEINSTALRKSVTQKAKAMVDIKWTPTKDLVGWLGKTTFKKGISYQGIPYSQTAYQRDNVGFKNSLNNSDFYSNYTRSGKIMPKYGSDCSGFVSFAWGISRKTTSDFVTGIRNGTYKKVGAYNANDPTKSSLMSSYRSLQRGDAVVKAGHTFLIASNNSSNSRVYVYEQTPDRATYTSWTYDKMATEKYMPFTLTYMDDPIDPYFIYSY